jgi:hypothetical protein
MIWWLENPARARSERQSVADLAERASWLRGARWYLSNGAALVVDFEIEHDGESVPLTMTYAEFHPNAPPIVLPPGQQSPIEPPVRPRRKSLPGVSRRQLEDRDHWGHDDRKCASADRR